MSRDLDIRPILEDDDLLVWYHAGTNDRLVVSFSGIGEDASIPAPIEFARLATQDGENHALFISDPNRTWLNGDGLIEKITAVIDEVRDAYGASETQAIGHSMGGFSAIAMAHFTQIDRAIAFAPQFSVHPKFAGHENRWREWKDKIANFRINDCCENLSDDTQVFIFHGGIAKEELQREAFPNRANIFMYVLRECGHDVPQRMRKFGVLNHIMKNAMLGRPRLVMLDIKKLNGYHRKGPTKSQ